MVDLPFGKHYISLTIIWKQSVTPEEPAFRWCRQAAMQSSVHYLPIYGKALLKSEDCVRGSLG